MQIDSPHI